MNNNGATEKSVGSGVDDAILSSLYDIESSPSVLRIRGLEDAVADAKREIAQLQAALAASQQALKRSDKRVTKLSSVCATLVRNMSALYTTAHGELQRKKIELESWKRY